MRLSTSEKKRFRKKKLTNAKDNRYLFQDPQKKRAQIIDDAKNNILSFIIDEELKIKKEFRIINYFAEILAKKANEKILKIYFDRGIYKYHGRVKIFAETLRKNGMEF